MQSLIFIIISTFLSIITSNFIYCVEKYKGNDFKILDYIKNFKLKNISIQYLLIFFILLELLCKNLEIMECIYYVPLCLALVLAFMLDIKYMIIPDTSNIIIAICGILKIITKFSIQEVGNSILGFLVGGLTFYIINVIFEKITHKVGFGFGDIKLLATLGLFFGVKGIVILMILSIVISAIFSIIFLLYNFIKKKKEEYLPFGPFIVISALILCIVPANIIIQTYFILIDKIVSKI